MVGGEALIGRKRETERLRQHIGGVVEGRGGLVLVSGEPGVGKSRLVQVAVGHGRCTGFTTAWGRCLETEGAPPFWPWIQVLRALSSRPGGEACAAVLPALTGASPDGDRFRLFDTITRALVDATAPGPLLLAFDDLHRADEASLALLRFTVSTAQDEPLMCLGTYRATEVPTDHPLASLLGDVAGEAVFDLIELTGLSRDETEEFVRRFADVDAGLDVGLLHTRTSGNPFYLGELVRLGADPEVVPASVDAATWARVRRLPARTRVVLTDAAVLGRDVDPALLASIRSTTPEEVASALVPAVRSGLITGPAPSTGQYRFEHVLVQQALYQRLDAADRVVLHGRALAALEDRIDDPAFAAAVAHHAVEAADSAAGRARARALAEHAADRAMAGSGDDTAADWYRRALALTDPDDPTRPGLLVKLGRAAGRAGHTAAARRSFEQAWELAARGGSAPAAAEAAIGLGEVVLSAGTLDVGLVRTIERTLARLPDDGPTVFDVRLRARLATELYWGAGLVRSRTLARSTVGDARTLDDPRCLAAALAAQLFVLRGPDGPEERLAVGRELLDLAVGLEDEELELTARRLLVPERLQRDLAEADAELDGLALLAQRSGRPLARWYLELYRAVRATMHGRLDEALGQVDHAEAEGLRLRVQPASLYATGQRFLLLRQTGRVAEAEIALRDQAARWPILVTFRCQLALLLADTGRDTEALALLDGLVADRCAVLPRDSLWLASVAILAEAASRLGHRGHCAVLHDLLAPYRGRIAFLGAVAWWGAVDHYLGLTAAARGDVERAEAYYRDALRLHEAWQATPFVAATLDAQAALPASCADGLLPIPAPRDGEHRTVASTPAGAPDAESGLTRREEEVLDHLADGASNKEIARALALSVHTVERHVANVYRKIGARNRADATSYALRRSRTRR
ncbi:MAG: transcriptional regulator, LuxR family [Actinomycetospora sp.]|nr:transcriptional regulator, LuxR family [Actinomycetospora sp.]